MAGKALGQKPVVAILIAVGVWTLLAVLLSLPMASLEDGLTGIRYEIRGDISPDSSIVVIYIDNEAVKTLGWPVRRNFHALMVAALSDLGVRAIGIDVLFEDASQEYPEYDALFASVIASSGCVVLPGYFEKVTAQDPEGENWMGEGFHSPHPSFARAAASLGHLNMVPDGNIPLAIQWKDGMMKSFAGELVRISSKDPGAMIPGDSSRGNPTSINFPGPITAFPLFPFVEVLRSYDAAKSGQEHVIPVGLFRDKIVLVGIIADGRSTNVATPIDPRYPSLGIHAALADNLLQERLLEELPPGLHYLLIFLTALLSGSVILYVKDWKGTLGVGALVAGLAMLSQYCFSLHSFLLPVGSLAVAALVSAIGAAGYKHRLTSGRLKDLQTEQNGILERLRDREAKVEVLQQELIGLETRQARDRSESLQMEIRRYKAEIRALSAKADDLVPYDQPDESGESLDFEGIRGDKRGPMKAIADLVIKIADSDAAVLILGESGTGKELVARALHKKSRRAGGPFIPVNCGALSETLLESELFGHEKGAFTGAMKEKPGRFELADGGTIFLDEIGEITENFQVKLLRVLQEGEVERVGGTRTIQVNVRLLAATNQDLKSLIALKRFREDLYYRLNVLSVEIPPLRERVGDIPVLVGYFLSREGQDLRVSQNVLNAFEHYPWPGNVRELESVVKRGVLLAKAEGRSMVTMQDLGEDVRSATQGAITLEEQILQSLREKGFSRNAISATAVELGGLNRGTVAEYLRGECLQAFVEHGFDLEKAARAISLTNDPEVNQRVTKRITDYLANLSEGIDMSQPWEQSNTLLRSKVKNLPQRYHQSAERVAEGIFRGLWKQ